MSKKRRAKCPFCGEVSRLTNEDVVSQWAARELRRLNPHAYVHAMIANVEGDNVVHQKLKKVGSVADLKMPLCDPCNKLFGKELENPASEVLKPTLGGTATSLSPANCEQVAAWGTLKSLCYDIIEPSPARIVFQNELHEFRAVRQPSTGFEMWLAKYEGHDSDLGWHVRATTVNGGSDLPGFPVGTPHAQVLTRILGNLVMQSVYIGIKGRVFRSRYDRPEGDPFAVRIWPCPVGDVEWPPPKSLTPETLGLFADVPITHVGEHAPFMPRLNPGKPEGPERPHGLVS